MRETARPAFVAIFIKNILGEFLRFDEYLRYLWADFWHWFDAIILINKSANGKNGILVTILKGTLFYKSDINWS